MLALLVTLVLAASPEPGGPGATPASPSAAPAAHDSARAPGSLRAGGADASAAEVRAQALSHLGAIDRPVSPETWRALGPAAEPVLLEVAGSTSEPPTRRARALEGLAALGGARAEQLHLRLARERGAPPIVRSGAVRGLGRLLEPARLATEVRPLLADEATRVRRVAGEVLARRAPAEACADVRAQAGREPAPARWSRALSDCDRAAARPGTRPRTR
jgi:HEAT repeat protein